MTDHPRRSRRSYRFRHPVRSIRRWWRHRPPRDNGLAIASFGIMLIGVAVIILALKH